MRRAVSLPWLTYLFLSLTTPESFVAQQHVVVAVNQK